jgi:hypothetical protein
LQLEDFLYGLKLGMQNGCTSAHVKMGLSKLSTAPLLQRLHFLLLKFNLTHFITNHFIINHDTYKTHLLVFFSKKEISPKQNNSIKVMFTEVYSLVSAGEF